MQFPPFSPSVTGTLNLTSAAARYTKTGHQLHRCVRAPLWRCNRVVQACVTRYRQISEEAQQWAVVKMVPLCDARQTAEFETKDTSKM